MLDFFDSSSHTFSKRFDFVLQTMEYLNEKNVSIGCVTNGRDFFRRKRIEALGL
jgi:putative hydrolase of the HAD superfamily